MTKQLFWQRWLRGETKKSLREWLESQGVDISLSGDKLTLYQLQWMTFEEDYAFFWAYLYKKYTGLPVDLRLDELGCQRGHELVHFSRPLLTFQNTYDDRIWVPLPMSISLNPKVLEDEKYIRIKSEDVEAVRQFIIKHYELLMKHWNQEITTTELCEILKKETQKNPKTEQKL